MLRLSRCVAISVVFLALVACRSRRGGDAPAKDKKQAPAPPSSQNVGPSPAATSTARALPQKGITTPPGSSFAADADGETVYDRARDVTWLADANLAATLPLGVKGINPSGSMSYPIALRWVAALNAYGNGAGYLGRTDWRLPSTPTSDPSCSSRNRHSFGFGCSKSMLAEVYAKALGSPRRAPPSSFAPPP